MTSDQQNLLKMFVTLPNALKTFMFLVQSIYHYHHFNQITTVPTTNVNRYC
jgi:hypothetical protein